jgi:hypothetical protein
LSSPALSEGVHTAPQQRRGLTTKRPAAGFALKQARLVEGFAYDIDGVPIDNHPIFRAYGKLSCAARRCISQEASQHEYRVLEQLKKGESVVICSRVLEISAYADGETVRETAENVLFQCMARDDKLDKSRRGYACRFTWPSSRMMVFPAGCPPMAQFALVACLLHCWRSSESTASYS